MDGDDTFEIVYKRVIIEDVTRSPAYVQGQVGSPHEGHDRQRNHFKANIIFPFSISGC